VAVRGRILGIKIEDLLNAVAIREPAEGGNERGNRSSATRLEYRVRRLGTGACRALRVVKSQGTRPKPLGDPLSVSISEVTVERGIKTDWTEIVRELASY